MDKVTLTILILWALKLFIIIDPYLEQFISRNELQYIRKLEQEANELADKMRNTTQE